MRRIALVTFSATTALTVAAGSVLAFGASREVGGQAQAGDAAVSITNYQPLTQNGHAVAVDQSGQPQAVATGVVSNVSSGQGQAEVVSGSITHITAVAPSQPTQGDTAGCNAFIARGGVTGTVQFPSAAGSTASAVVLNPPPTASAASSTFQVALAMQTNPLDAYGASVCSDQQFTFDVILTSALPT